MEIQAVSLKKGKEINVQRRHPWLFSGALKEQSLLPEGTIVKITSHNGEPLGYGFFLGGSLRIKLFAFSEKVAQSPLQCIQENLRSAIRLRNSLGFKEAGTNCFRVVNAEGDSLPGLIVDKYESVAVLQLHHVGWKKLLPNVAEVILAETECKHIFVKSHESVTEEWLTDPTAAPITVTENGLRYAIDFIEGQKTGFFLDQRENRSAVGRFARNRRVLNLFAYSGGFSMAAIRGGANHARSVDVSQKACHEASHNATLNDFSDLHSAECADCFTYVEKLPEDFDFVVLDPPALTKHKDSIQQAIKGYKHLNRSVIRQLPKHGLLATFSCSQLVSRDQFESLIYGVSIEVGRPVKILSRFSQAPCHPSSVFHAEGTYLKGTLLEVL